MKRPSARRPPASWYDQCLRLLSVRPRSEHELRQRLTSRGAPAGEIDAVMHRLAEAGLVDDRSFAAAWVESRNRASPRGARLLQAELRAKGVGAEEIEHALAASFDHLALAQAAASRKARTLASAPDADFREKLTAFLIRRGFDYDDVASVVREMLRSRDR